MEMYQLWDVGSGNRLGEFYTEGEALETVRVIIRDDPGAVETLALLVEDSRGDLAEISSGPELLKVLHQPA
jgi:hypothetical protein